MEHTVMERPLQTKPHLPRQSAFDLNASKALKGVAILLMLLHHCFLATGRFEGIAISFAPFSMERVVNIARMSKICVSLFAFTSGYGLYLSYDKKKCTPDRWTLERYVKTFSGFWFVWVFSAIVCQVIDGRTYSVFFQEGLIYGAVRALINFLGLSALFGTPTMITTWWYMSAAVVYICLMPLLYKWIRTRPWVVLAFCVLFMRVIFAPDLDSAFTGGNSIYPFTAVFLLGAITARSRLIDRWTALGAGKPALKAAKCAGELVVLALAYKVYQVMPIKTFWEIHFCVIPFLVILFCVEFIIPIPGVNQFLQFMGKHSLNIYLVHTFIRGTYLHDFTYSWKHFLLIILVLVVISLAISFVLEWLKKLTRYDRLISYICGRIAKPTSKPNTQEVSL